MELAPAPPDELSKDEIIFYHFRIGAISVDAEGRVWRHGRQWHSGLHLFPRPRRLDIRNPDGYFLVKLRYKGKDVNTSAHRLQWMFHMGAVPGGLYVNHLDGNKSNNRLGNLELVTHLQNVRHSYGWTDYRSSTRRLTNTIAPPRKQKLIEGRTKEEHCLELIKQGAIFLDDLGRVWRTLKRNPRGRQPIVYSKPRRIDHPDKLGYCRFGFSIGRKRIVAYAHRMVWVYHNGPIPDGKEINHKDERKSNNAIANLELLTRVENMRLNNQKPSHLAHLSRSVPRKLNWDQVREIRRMHAESGQTYGKLAKQFGVTTITIGSIIRNQTWKAAAAQPSHSPTS